MSESSQPPGLPSDFDGVVRLFPLGGLVLFPNVVQPLHIFEPRYCDMLEDAQLTDGLIAIATALEPHESSYQTFEPIDLASPRVGNTICVGRVISHTATDDGRHNILLVGVKRAKITKELEVATPFRQAMVEILEDQPVIENAKNGEHRKRLVKLFQSISSVQALGGGSEGKEWLESAIPIGMLVDLLAFGLPLSTCSKLDLLKETDQTKRAELLLRYVKRDGVDQAIKQAGGSSEVTGDDRSDDSEFPPKFSLN